MTTTAPLHFTRRRAMALMAASTALAQGACTRAPQERIHAFVDLPEAHGGGLPLYYATAWLHDGHAQPVLVGTREGRPVKVEGHPRHPASRGATSVFAQASVLQLWDPDRSQSVLQRLGPSAPLADSSWGAFDAAWATQRERLRATGGRGLHVLCGPSTSPLLAAQVAQLRDRWPLMQWHLHAPLAPPPPAGFGRPVRLQPRLDGATCVLALGADPFSDGPDALRLAAEWAARRTAGQAPRLMALETTPGLFGARADWRHALAPWQIERLWWAVAARLVDGVPAPPLAPPLEALVAPLVQALRGAGAGALVMAGPALSPASQALAQVVSQRLGAGGRTLLARPSPAVLPDGHSLPALVEAMRAGEVHALLILDANPVYDGDAAFARALQRVPFSAHHGLYADETAQACHWHLPAGHVYEQWSDARADDGSAVLLQPAIAPLYDSRSVHALLSQAFDEAPASDHALLQRHWRGTQRRGFDPFWQDSLRRGTVAGSTPEPMRWPTLPVPAPPAFAAPADDTIDVLLHADAAVHDGRYANLGWLQELPRPFTRLTWDHALLLGPATARTRGLATGDVVRTDAGTSLPVWVEPSHAEGAASLALGGGRRSAGRVGNGIGPNAWTLKPPQGWVVSLRLQRTDGQHAFAVVQHELAQHGRDLARVRQADAAPEPQAEHPSLYPPRPRGEHAWAMVIDLDACIGCQACTVACQAENNIPVVGREEVARGRAMHWIRVDRHPLGDTAPGTSVFQPVPCMHCEQAPCELVCPVGATVHDSEGLNVQVYNRCIGTRFCSNNCPYKVRRFNFLQYSDLETETLKAQRNPDVTVRTRGVMEKCTYCVQRIATARQAAHVDARTLQDGDVVTACQAACPTRAIHFGDLQDPGSDVSRLQASPRRYTMLDELNTRPRTTYLARVAPPGDRDG